jgi:phosphohistidine phosphatase
MPESVEAKRELVLLRHGIAEERSPDRADAGRALTDQGRQRTRAVLRKALSLGLQAERLVSSPLVRASQTAEIALAVGLAPALELAESLAPGADPLPLVEAWLASGRNGEPAQHRLLLVGHEPDLGLLAARLIRAAPGSITLRKAGLALLAFEAGVHGVGPPVGEASLRLLLSPRSLLA